MAFRLTLQRLSLSKFLCWKDLQFFILESCIINQKSGQRQIIRPLCTPVINEYTWMNKCGYLCIVIMHSHLLFGFFQPLLSWSREAGSRPGALQRGESQGPGPRLHRTHCELHPWQRSPQCQDHHRCLSSSQSESKAFVLPGLIMNCDLFSCPFPCG